MIRPFGGRENHLRPPDNEGQGKELKKKNMPLNGKLIEEKLAGYPDEVVGDLERFAREGDLHAFEQGLLGALGFLSENSDVKSLTTAADDIRLREDLGVDSLAVAELVFLIEDAFGVAIQDEEIAGLQTISDFKRLAKELVANRIS